MAIYLGYNRVGIVKYIDESIKISLKTLTGTYLFNITNAKNAEIYDLSIKGNTIQRVLPSEYQEVEYLTNSGTQRIDTGLVPTNSTSIDITYQSLQPTGTSQYIAGSRLNQSTTVEYAINGSSSNAYWDVRLGGATTTITDVSRMTNKYRSYLNITNGTGSWTLTHTTTDTTYSKTISGAEVNATANLFLFAYNNLDTNTHINLRIFACKIYEAGVLVRNFIPCYRKSDQEAGMYELVENKFYTNAGTGDFAVGSNYESQPSLETPAEIISVGERTKNLVNIPIIDSSVGTKTLSCYIDQTISFSCQEYPTLIARDDGTETSIWRIAFKRLDGSTTYAVDSALRGEGTTLTTVTADNPIISIEYRSTYIREGAYKGIQIEYGREITDYEPYGYKIPVNLLSENLANSQTIQENKLIGNSANGIINDSETYNTLYMEVEEGKTYKFKNFVRANGTSLRGCFYNENGAWVSAFDEITITIPSGVKFVGRSFSKEAQGVELREILSTNNIYAKEPLRKINDVADVLDYKNKKVIRNVGSVIYNATESWSKYDSGNGYMETNDLFPDGKPVICNRFINSQTLIKTLAIRKNYANIYVYGVYDYYPTQAEWHAFLAENPMEVIGQLVTPIEEEITSDKIMLRIGTNTMEIVTDIKPSEAELKYWEVDNG